MEPFDVKGLIGVGGYPIIQALVAVFKTTFPNFPPQYLMSVSVLIGMILNAVLAYFMALPMWEAVIVGMVAGLIASGAYSTGKRLSQ
jgi:hypothetical protein